MALNNLNLVQGRGFEQPEPGSGSEFYGAEIVRIWEPEKELEKVGGRLQIVNSQECHMSYLVTVMRIDLVGRYFNMLYK